MIVTLLVGLLAILVALSSIPSVQGMGGSYMSTWLSGKIGSNVHVGKLKLGMAGRVILDDIQIYDRDDSLMLNVARMAVKMDFLSLADGCIHINNAQLLSANVHLYKHRKSDDLNIQYLIDAFTADDTTGTTPDIKVETFIMRRGRVRYDKYYEPELDGKFNKDHVELSDIAMTVRIGLLSKDSTDITLKHLSLREKCGLHLRDLQFSLSSNGNGGTLEDMCLSTNNSELSIPHVRYAILSRDSTGKANPCGITAEAFLAADIVPSDISPFLPQLSHFDRGIHIESCLSLYDGRLDSKDTKLYDEERDITYNGCIVVDSIFGNPCVSLNVEHLGTSRQAQDFIWQGMTGNTDRHVAVLDALGETDTHGVAYYCNGNVNVDLHTTTEAFVASLKGTLDKDGAFNASMSTDRMDIHALIGNTTQPARLSAIVHAKGRLKDSQGKPSVSVNGLAKSLTFGDYTYSNIPLSGSMVGDQFTASLDLEDVNGNIMLDCKATLGKEEKRLECTIDVSDFSPFNMNLTKKYENERFGGILGIDLNFKDINSMNGTVQLDDFTLSTEGEGTFAPGDITVTAASDTEGQQLNVDSKFLTLQAEGSFRWQDLYASVLGNTHDKLPSLIPTPTKEGTSNDFKFSCRVQDTILLRKLADLDLSIPMEAVMDGGINDETGRITLNASIPELIYGGNVFKNTQLNSECSKEIMQASMKTDRMTKDKPVTLNLNAYANLGNVKAELSWDNNNTPVQKGSFNVSGRFITGLSGNQGIESRITPSDIIINDTVWKVSPGYISIHDKVVDLAGIKVSSDDRHLTLNGRLSNEETDTLTVGLKDVSLSYIFNIIDFHSVELDGKATGQIYARTLSQSPMVDAYLQVHDFTFNDAYLGNMDIYGNFGDNGKSITLDADINDLSNDHHTTVKGYITPGRGPNGGLELNIDTRRINIHFLNMYTSGIFRDFNGRASGWARVFGPFKKINLEGDLLVEEASLHVLALGTDYRLRQDSVILRPDNIWIRNATLYDYQGREGLAEHSARLQGHLAHESLKRLRYDISVDANKLLCYNTTARSGNSFYGTAYASGDIHLKGEPGRLDVNVQAVPASGTTMVYNVASPETLTETGFISYTNATDTVTTKVEEEEEENTTTDIHIDFNLNLNPEAAMKLVMDHKSGDCIYLYGNGHILARYYNKGKFQMFGTYRVDHGTYNMSMQDVIRKDFIFKPDGTIVFGGDAYKASLNLQATYTVPNVSLDDLSYSGLGLSNTRVDCIMNIGGTPKQPNVTFDFDLPNANEDEKQMVRSMISTEEEKNMQTIYLLGIGRFYSYGAQYSTGGGQGEMAMNSLLSSTLSSQFNRIISSAIGSNNWSFGTNLRTGETGWDQLDVEGMLSGRLLDNRLLLNGNFGYRESYYNNNNFIGDFDIQYVLNRAKTLSLRAYNQTNDRYFIQSSLTTQGIGLKFQHDFGSWKDFFRKQGKRQK